MAAATTTITTQALPAGIPLPRVTIQFCTQCKWMLRAAYYAQELLSTFSTALGEVALQPSTGGTFIVTITHATNTAPATADPQDSSHDNTAASKVLWDRRTDGGFPETKELKRRVRDVVEPGRDLGHVDRHNGGVAAKAGGGANDKTEQQTADADADGKGGEQPKPEQDGKKACEDCN